MQPIDPGNLFNADEPTVGIPPWWRAFVFQVLNGRQLAVYLYVVSLMGESGVCSPTTQQITDGMGLLSPTMVFDSINVLEEYGFLLRWRRNAPALGSRRNVYQRPSCEYTILQLLRRNRIDDRLRVRGGGRMDPLDEALLADGLRRLLADGYADYESAGPAQKREVLVGLLEAAVKNMRGLDEMDAS